MAFTVIVVYDNTNFVELLNLRETNITQNKYSITPTKFTTACLKYNSTFMIQWMTSNDVSSASNVNYFVYVLLIDTSAGLEISILKDADYLLGMSINFLLVSSTISVNSAVNTTAFYSYKARTG